jgi:uncharacterized membrane protein YcfT
MDTQKKNEFTKRALKYFIQWLVVALALKFIPVATLDNQEILKISIIAVVTFAILDMYYPAVETSLLA